MVKPVILCIAKTEEKYIEEFVRYHLAIGFTKIFIFDNEEFPTYKKLLKPYNEYIEHFHLPIPGCQQKMLDSFVNNVLPNAKFTHIIHMDIDEFIVLKKHKNIIEFIKDYIKNDCEAIAINWRFFGSYTSSSDETQPVTQRFTMCEKKANRHIKTISAIDNIAKIYPHHVILNKGSIKRTNGETIRCWWDVNEDKDIDTSVIQMNHYKSKTWKEFKDVHSRRGDVNHFFFDTPTMPRELMRQHFFDCDKNDIEDTSASDFYKNVAINWNP